MNILQSSLGRNEAKAFSQAQLLALTTLAMEAGGQCMDFARTDKAKADCVLYTDLATLLKAVAAFASED